MPRSLTYTGGYGGARLRTYIGLLGTYRRNLSFAEHDYEQVFRQAKSAFEHYGEIPLEEARVLEIGCGQRYSATLLFHSLGVHIVGIDYDVINTRTSWQRLTRCGVGERRGADYQVPRTPSDFRPAVLCPSGAKTWAAAGIRWTESTLDGRVRAPL